MRSIDSQAGLLELLAGDWCSEVCSSVVAARILAPLLYYQVRDVSVHRLAIGLRYQHATDSAKAA